MMTTTLFYHTHFFDVGSCTRFLQISSEPSPRRGVGDARSPRCRYAQAISLLYSVRSTVSLRGCPHA
jgi:hypothetical protein